MKIPNETMHVIEQLVDDGYIRRVDQDGLRLYNYTQKTHWDGHWNELTAMCRGLIVGPDNEIVARPFDKFFNWGEGGRKSAGHIVNATEKIDGSLGILYQHKDKYRIATRGAFDSDQAQWATEFYNRYYGDVDVPYQTTLLFEIVYPENRVVVDYGDEETLILLTARNIRSGEYWKMFPDLIHLADTYDFPLPRLTSFNSVKDILVAQENISSDQEGWVVEFSDDQRFKFKGDRYIELHRLLHTTSFKRVVQAMKNDTLSSMILGIPDEFLGQITEWRTQIDAVVDSTYWSCAIAFEAAPRSGTRKDFALWAQEHHPDKLPYLFAMLDGKDIKPMIYDIEFRDWSPEVDSEQAP